MNVRVWYQFAKPLIFEAKLPQLEPSDVRALCLARVSHTATPSSPCRNHEKHISERPRQDIDAPAHERLIISKCQLPEVVEAAVEASIVEELRVEDEDEVMARLLGTGPLNRCTHLVLEDEEEAVARPTPCEARSAELLGADTRA